MTIDKKKEEKMSKLLAGAYVTLHQSIQDQKGDTETLKKSSNLATHSCLIIGWVLSVLLSEFRDNRVGDNVPSTSDKLHLGSVKDVRS